MPGTRRHRRVVRRSAVDPAPDGRDVRVAVPSDEPVLPARAAEDCDSAWGDTADSNDRRLRENVPPHW